MVECLGLYSQKDVDKLQGNSETLEYVEGCLLDHYVFYSEELGQYVFATEHYLNTWSSCYKVYAGDEEIFEMFYKVDDAIREVAG